MRLPSVSPIPPVSPMPSTARAPSNAPAAIPPRTSNGPPVPWVQCAKCRLLHAPSRKCPSLASEIQIRIALDDVKGLSEGDPGAMQRNKVLLQSFLKERKASRGGNNGGPSPQPQQLGRASQPPQQQTSRRPVQPVQPVQLAQQPARQFMQQPAQQAQLSAPVESSGSESSSESESGSESGSDSSSESGKDVMREILSR